MHDSLATRSTLLNRVKDPNDEAAWEDFVDFYHGFIQMILNKMRIAQSEREDLTQEIIIKLWASLQAFDLDNNRAKFRTWLSTVIRNTCLDYLQSTKSRKQREDNSAREDGEFAIFSVIPSELDQIIDQEWAQYMLERVIEHLKQFFSGKAIDVFLLSCENKSVDEISQLLDIPANTVYVLRSRVKNRFMAELKQFRALFEF
ncbi:MAG: RNA polymerase sigma factor [Lentisphaeraceae bacterium]|nr:RNA polymerase sigma factor [Lentisphaeraceae bacterium]